MTHPDPAADPLARLHLKIQLGGDVLLGPGKAELLEHIRDTGSISAAGRAMQMSYKRAWLLVEEMNAAFRDPLVDSVRGGPGGGGAQLTASGQAVLHLYRQVALTAALAASDDIDRLAALLRDMSARK